jgi:hypothetical protein
MLNLVLVRDCRTETAIMGHLLFNGTVICYTLENKAKAIPCGIYNIENSKSPKFKRELPLLYNKTVAESRGIRIHSGNTSKDSAGCVLVGMGREIAPDGSLSESRLAETMVTMLCRTVKQMVICEV